MPDVGAGRPDRATDETGGGGTIDAVVVGRGSTVVNDIQRCGRDARVELGALGVSDGLVVLPAPHRALAALPGVSSSRS